MNFTIIDYINTVQWFPIIALSSLNRRAYRNIRYIRFVLFILNLPENYSLIDFINPWYVLSSNYEINCYHQSSPNDFYMVDQLCRIVDKSGSAKIHKNKSTKKYRNLSRGDVVILELFFVIYLRLKWTFATYDA